ncbi:helix-turn-helix domain-containing protein [Cardiobacteriaceae bacterium TAE3-ERU3]|nr:helix-turn-helix domain-containing protein [Cardiobacteriaceae bacterium TAE3-ERU3]
MQVKNIDERVRILEDQVAQLLAQLNTPAPTTKATDKTFAALNNLQQQTADAAQGAVMFSGYYRQNAGSKNEAEWQYTVENSELLASDWASLAEPLAALSHPVRLSLLQGIFQGETTAANLAAQLGLGSTGQVYHHLNALQSAGWIRRTVAEGYNVPAERMIALLVILLAAQR